MLGASRKYKRISGKKKDKAFFLSEMRLYFLMFITAVFFLMIIPGKPSKFKIMRLFPMTVARCQTEVLTTEQRQTLKT